MDTQSQNFWLESIKKEAAVRLAWHSKYSKNFSTYAQSKSPGYDNIPAKGSAGIASRISKLNSSISKNTEAMTYSLTSKSQTAHKSDSALPVDANSLKCNDILHDMRPVSSQTHSLLYNGISALGEGRYAYLTKRKLKSPVEKYEFPILSSCQYGWKIMEYGIPKTSAYARTCVIKDSFYRPSGIIM